MEEYAVKEYIVKDGKKLRLGYTTGSCAAAAAKAAAWMLLSGRRKEKIRICTPKGITLDLNVLQISMEEDAVSCAVEKDSGDDPDVTQASLIFALVKRRKTAGIIIDGGRGVGRVTKPGLEQPVGAAAINAVPRQMIRENLEEVCCLTDYHGGLSVVISVADGEELAKKTFNPMLGILGGISILGTSGIVEPMSERALVDTIELELRQRKAAGAKYVLLTPGNYGSAYIQKDIGLDLKIAVLTSNFIGESLDLCRELGFRGALLIGHIGKLIKIAGGMLNTHSRYGDCRMDIMAAHAGAAGLPASRIAELLDCVSCDAAIRVLKECGCCSQTLERISKRISFVMAHRVAGEMETGAILFSREYGFLSATENAGDLLKLIREE
ncbi:MAG: cobalt-precorrin-5B (C(1))-methyltransferase CbiD [Bacillota bacterium]|nr:cobalt-precorrin-5B (C(1))-methyltransferase CbiD [Bacillota bacterium]